jgi:hypothetical protein
MNEDIFTGKVYGFGSKGSPLVKLEDTTVMINGFKSAYKPPVGSDIAFTIIKSTMQLNHCCGLIINDTPQKNIGTICSRGYTSESYFMECGGKIIVVKSSDNSFKIGDVKNYSIIADLLKSQIAWTYDDPAVDTTISGMQSLITKMTPPNNQIFSNILNTVYDSYHSENYGKALFNIDRMYKILSAKGMIKNHTVKNPLKFLELKIKEECNII